MTIVLKPYPRYKNSGVPWLDRVPNHWSVLPGKACLREKKISNKGMKETTVLTLSYGQINIRPPEKLHGLVPESFETYQIIEPGNIVFRPTDLQNDWVSLRTGISRHRGIITSAYLCLKTREPLDEEYGHLLLHTYDLMKIFYGLGSGLRQNIDWRDFKYLPCLVPPLDEQKAIVRYLAYIDHQIKRYIRAKQKQIKLLEEQKQGIINQAVTRGLDPSVRVKHSGVEWLEEIPETWSIYRIRNAVNVIVSNVDKHIKDNEYPVRLCNYVDVYKNNRITNKVKFMTATALMEEIQQFRLQKNDVLITKDSEMWNDIGVPALVDYSADDLICGYHLAILRPKNNMIIGGYLFWLLQSNGISSQFYISANGVTRYGLSHAAIKNVIVPIPPLGEQQAISNYLDSVTTNYDRAIVTVRKEISLLKEYYERLIADVVTGRFDVQAAADHLPKEIKVIESVKEEEFSDEESEYQVELEVDLEEGET